jgi:hypothetical protein
VTTSIPPPIKSSGNTKYIVIGAVMVVGGVGAAMLALNSSPTPAPAPVPTPTVAQDAAPPRVTPTVAAEIDLGEEPDAAVEAPPQDASGPHVRYVVRYVNQCPGTIDIPRVDAVLAASQGGFRECYNRELRTNQNLRGGATVRFMINTNGSVGDISTGGIVRSGPFKACFETVLRRLRFPTPRGGCVIKETRFNFTAS